MMDADLVDGLRSQGIDVLTSEEAGKLQCSDEDQLAFASDRQRVLCSFNIRDYHALRTKWMRSDRTHYGLILWRQKRYTVREEIRKLVHLTSSSSREEMINREEFLGAW